MKRTIRRLLIFALILFLAFPAIFADTMDVKAFFLKDLKPPMLAIASSYVNVPKINLNGITYTNGKGFFPSRIELDSSDVSLYRDELLNPSSDGILGFLSSLTSSLSPVRAEADKALSERDFQRGEFVVDGYVNIDGGDQFSLSLFLFYKDFSSISGFVDGEICISGDKDITLVFSFSVRGAENRKIILDDMDVKINGDSVNIKSMMISFKEF